MGTNQTITPSKSENLSSIVQEHPSVHPYPDWASMQAYYGPGVPIPPPYFSATVAPGHAPHPYMWSPQAMMAPFGGPYTAIYPHGGVYPHPSATHVSFQMASPVNPEVPAKPSTNKETALEKKSKGLDNLAAPIGNSNTKGAGCNENRSSESGDNETEGSSDGSDVNTESRGTERKRIRCSEDLPNSESDAPPTISLEMNATPAIITGKALCTSLPANLTPGMELKPSCVIKLKPGGEKILPTTMVERELKRERRKQSNRESARRSRLRKQAETEELAIKVGKLTAENTTLRSEITRLTESSEKIRLENSALMEKLRMVKLGREEDIMSDRIDHEDAPTIVIENLLSRIDNSNPVCGANQMEDEARENSSVKLHQLLGSNSRTDSLTASLHS